jgi:hypothetical protein
MDGLCSEGVAMKRSAWRLPLVAWLAGVGATMLAGWLMAGVAYSAPPTPVPGYLSDDYRQLALASNDLMSGAKIVGRSYPVQLSPKAGAPEVSAPIWTPRCPASAETVTFSRNVWLPGPPNYGASFTYGAALGFREFDAFSTIDLIVNGVQIVHRLMPSQTGYFRVPVDGPALKAFRPEQNLIQVRVLKRATRRPCNTGDPATQLGLVFRLNGQFQTDLAVNPPSQLFQKLSPGTTSAQQVNVQFRNLGPAWEPNGSFLLNVSGAPDFAIGTLPGPGPPLTNCQQTDNPAANFSHSVSCGVSNFAPGTEAALSVVFRVKAPSSDYTDFSVAFSWTISAGGVSDLNPANNTSHATITFCGSKSTNPGCQTAS